MQPDDQTTRQIRFQAQLLDSVRESVVATDLDGTVIYWGKGAEALYGYTRDEALGRSITFVVPPGDEPEVLRRIEQVRRTGSCSGEYSQRRKDGSTFVTDMRISLVRDAEGRPCGLIGIDRDVTRRKRDDEALRRAHDHIKQQVEERTTDAQQALAELRELHDIVSSSPAVVFRWRVVEGWPVEFVSENVRQFGYTAEEIRSGAVSWLEVIHPEDLHRLVAEIEKHLRDGTREFNQEYRLFTRSGEVRWIHDWNRTLTGDGGKATHIQGVILDVTGRKRFQEALRQREALLTSMIENLPVDFWARDAEDRLFLQSRQSIANWGDQRNKGFNEQDLDPETLQSWTQNNRRALAGEIVRGEVRLVTHDGQVREFFNVVAPIVEQGSTLGVVGINIDITARKQAEQAVRQSEEKYRSLAEKVYDIPYSMDAHGILTYVGPQVARYGRDPDDMVGRSFLEFIDPQDRRQVSDEFQRTVTAGAEFPSEFRVRTPDGRVVWMEDAGRLQRDEQGRPVGVAGVLRDVTERRQLARALRESESLLREVLDLNPACIFIKNRQGVFLLANKAMAEFYGTTSKAMLGRRLSDFYEPSPAEPGKLEALLAGDQEVIRSRRPQVIPEEAFTARDGTMRWFQAVKIPLAVKGDPQCVLGVAVDITARKRAEQAILEEQQRLRHLLSMHERDRQLVAFEIHDGFAQPLTAALMQLEAGLQAFKSPHSAAMPSGCENAADLLRRSIDEARRLMSGLRPAVLDEFGVVAAIESLVGEYREKTASRIDLTDEVGFDRLAAPLELAIFRIIQEGLTNAVRYSRSERIRVALCQQDDRLRIEVEDWGVGFDPAHVDPNRFGLEGIRVRARLFGGKAVIRSTPGHGTAITAEIPLVEPPVAEKQE